MAKSVLHPISTRDSNISPRVEGQRADVGRGLVPGMGCDADFDTCMYYSLFIVKLYCQPGIIG